MPSKFQPFKWISVHLGHQHKILVAINEPHTIPSLQVERVAAIYFQSTNFPPFALNRVRKETPWDEDKGEGHVQSICCNVIAEIEELTT